MVHLSCCHLKLKKGDKGIYAIAILKHPGTADAIAFILPNGKPHTKQIWDYRLMPGFGAVSLSVEGDSN